MPQFDFTQFSSQIFWLLLCFAVLYYFASKIILPRIHEILSDRRNLISQNDADSAALKSQIADLQEQTNKIRREGSVQYQEKIENALRLAVKEREEAIENLKIKLDAVAKESNRKIENFVSDSMAQSSVTIASLVKSIRGKILS